MTELFINGARADLDGAIPFPINYSIADIKNPEKRKRSASKSVKLPGTQNNLNIFSATNSLSVVVEDEQTSSSVSFDPTARVDGKYFRDGLLVFDGLVKLESVILENGYWQFEIILFSNILNIIKKLSEVNTDELGWSEYRHKINQYNVELSWDESVVVGADMAGDGGVDTLNFSGTPTANFANGLPESFGYVYPVADYGYARTAWNRFRTTDLQPCVYVREVMQKMLALPQIQLNYQSDFMDSNLFKKLIYGIGGGEKIGLSDAEILRRRVEVQGEIDFTWQVAGVWSPIINSWIFSLLANGGAPNTSSAPVFYAQTLMSPYLMSAPVNVISNLAGQYVIASGLITIQNSGNYRLSRLGDLGYRVQLGGMTMSGNGTRRIVMNVYRDSQEIQALKSQIDAVPISNDTYTYSSVSKSTEGYFEAGTVIKYEFVTVLNIRTTGDYEPVVFRVETNDIRIKLESIDTTIQEDNPVELSRFVPNMKCSDFFKGIITAFNLYVSDPDVFGVVRIEPLDTYFKPFNEYDDWTDKVDYSKAFKIRPAATIEGKFYKYRFKEENDYFHKQYLDQFGERYGDLTQEVQSPFNVGERVFELPFGQAIPVALGNSTPPALDYQPNFVVPAIFDLDTAGQKKPYKGKPKIYFYSGMRALDSDVGGWYLADANNANPDEHFRYPCANHFDDIDNPTIDFNFKLPLLLYWNWIAIAGRNLWGFNGQFFEELTSKSSAIVECYIKLMSADIFNMDFGKLKMIKGVLYRLNEIKDWDDNSYASAKVELLKVVPAQTPNQSGTWLPPEPFILQDEDTDETAFILSQNGEPILYNQ
jgi:hypothetical protein